MIGETVEKQLKDFKGFKVLKVTDDKGTLVEKTTYMLNTKDDFNVNCFSTLAELKSYVNNVFNN